MSKWQPIETAPRDKEILVYGVWEGELNGKEDAGAYVAKYHESRCLGAIWMVSGCEYYVTWVHATHWIPLPEPPND